MTEYVYDQANPANPETLRNLLANNICTISFVKLNGDKREMPCTLRKDVVPPAPVTESADKAERKRSDNTMSVWCIDANGWRSFRYDSVTRVVVNNAAH
jgi:hypothetical protein